jgi:hypothetical protein
VKRSAVVNGFAKRISPVRLAEPFSGLQGSWAEPPMRSSETKLIGWEGGV